MYDMIDSKDHLRSMYGFLFNLVTDSNLWPYVCPLLCLLTRKECVRLYRVRKLLELQTKLAGSARNYNSAWKTSLAAVQKSNACTVSSLCLPPGATAKKTISRKRTHLELPVLCAAAQMETQVDPFYKKKLVPIVQLQSFSELLNNLGNIELPAQMGSLLGSTTGLHYLDCVQDDSAYFRLNAWVGNALAEREYWGQTCKMNMTLSAFKDSVMEVVNFVGRLSSLGLQLESCHALLLSISLDFYEMVCDIFMKYGLPLVVMPPKGVFYPALLCREPISVDRLAHIMYRYKMNLTAAKEQQRQTRTLQEFNYYAKCMINCLWNIKPLETDMDLPISQEQLSSGNVPGFDLSHHPAFLIYAINFHRQCWPESRDIDLNSIKSTPTVWQWYKEYLYSHFEGLKKFETSMIRVKTPLKEGPH